MYQFDCRFCDTVVRTEGADSVKSRAKTHLERDHDHDVLEVLSDKYGDVACHNDCGSDVSINGNEAAEVECSRCGHDNFPPLLERFVYWQIKERRVPESES